MTDQERLVMSKLIDAWNAFCELPVLHGDDTLQFRLAIHSAQAEILKRGPRDDYNSGLTA